MEAAIKRFMDALKSGLEQASQEREAFTLAFLGVDVAGVVQDALRQSGLRLAQVSGGSEGTVEADHHS